MYNKEILKLSKIIVGENGKFSTKDIENCGLPFEIFLALSQLSSERCLSNAKKIIEKSEVKIENRT